MLNFASARHILRSCDLTLEHEHHSSVINRTPFHSTVVYTPINHHKLNSRATAAGRTIPVMLIEDAGLGLAADVVELPDKSCF